MINGVAFDLEGTVINLEKFHFDAFILAAAEFGLNLTFESLARQIPYAIGGGDKRISRGIAELLGKSCLEAEILTRKRESYSRVLESLSRIEVRPGFTEVLEEIKKLDLPVTIGSLTPIEYAKILLAKSGVGQLFPAENQVFDKDVKNLKPKPDVFMETARRMHIPPTEQLVFEDSATGIVAAHAAGSKVVVLPIYHFEENLHEIIKAGSTRIFLDWREMNILALINNLNQE
jgi:beta-phosphoglucomutase